MLRGNRELWWAFLAMIMITGLYGLVMTVEAGRTKGQGMGGHESKIHLTVAGIARFQGKGCDITLMTIITLERFTRSRLLMTV